MELIWEAIKTHLWYTFGALFLTVYDVSQDNSVLILNTKVKQLMEI